jgi:hypothetical protein
MITDNNLNKRLLSEAQRIGDRLLAEAETDKDGMYWQSMTMDMDLKISFVKSETIYSGVSGIVLFFLELYKQTRDRRYMDAAVQGMNWVVAYCEKNPSNYYALFTGRMGVSYTLLQMHAYTREEKYLEQALATAGPCRNFPGQGNIDDLINGSAGTLLGLLHLHAATGAEWLLETMGLYIRRLVERAHHGPAGLYWDRSHQLIGGLCGFSHGAAGIGFVFLELGHYFQNNAFYQAAEQAFLYERFRYQKSRLPQNWPDLRKGIYRDEDRQAHLKALEEENWDFFTSGSDMNAWCHGAAGIGLSRLRAYQLLKKDIYKKEARIAIAKTRSTDIESPNASPLCILCHGQAGNAELFLYAWQTLKNKKYLAMAETIAVNILDHHEKNHRYLPGFRTENKEEDTSLFMGNAGIGYFMLRLLNPLQVPSVLIPQVDGQFVTTKPAVLSKYPFISVSPAELYHDLLQKDFQRTLFTARAIMPQRVNAFLKDNRMNRMNTRISLSPKEKESLADVFDLEREKRRMDEAIAGHSLLNIKREVLEQQAEKITTLEHDAFLKQILTLEPTTRLFTTQWNWDPANRENWESNLQREKEEEICPLLLQPTSWGIKEYQLSPFVYTILYEFQKPAAVEQVIKVTIDAFEALSLEQEKTLKQTIIEQIKQALSAGILLQPPYKHEA